MIIAIVIAIGWGFCGVVAYGITLGYFQNKWKSLIVRSEHDRAYPYTPFFPGAGDKDKYLALFFGLMGPVGAITAFFLSERGKYGLLWKPLDPEA